MRNRLSVLVLQQSTSSGTDVAYGVGRRRAALPSPALQRRWDCETQGAASCGRPPLIWPPARLPAGLGGHFASGLATVVLAVGLAGCAGDGTGLDETGTPLTALVITLSDTILSLPVGAEFMLTAEVRSRQGALADDQTVVWSSGNENVAAVTADGIVTAVAPGETVIIAANEEASETTRMAVVASATLSADVQPIFNTAGCVNSDCHAGAQPQVGQNLTSGNAYANIVGIPSAELPGMDRIEPGNPELSYLVHKIQGTHLAVGGSGAQMPLGLGMLPQSSIDIIRAWIRTGAPNN